MPVPTQRVAEDIEPPAPDFPVHVRAYAELAHIVREEGLLKRAGWFYLLVGIGQVVLLAGIVAELIAPTAGLFTDAKGKTVKVNRAAPNAPSVVYDAALVPSGVGAALAKSGLALRFLSEAYRHGKPIAVAAQSGDVLKACDFASDDGVVVADPAKLASVLIEARRDAEGVKLSVTDHGDGIPEADRQRATERFVRLEASRTLPGSGLGLSLASAVAVLHGGELRLDDAHPGVRATLAMPGRDVEQAGA